MNNYPIVNAHAEMNDEKRATRDRLTIDLLNLLERAKRNGFVITVDLQALEPLAMRNYRMIGDVRGAR